MRFVLLLVALLLSGNLLAQETLAAERLIAVILPRDLPRYQAVHEVFRATLAKTDDQRVYVQTPNKDMLSLRNSARKAVAIGADVIVTYGALATQAALSESYSTPVVYADVSDPMVQGFIPDQFTSGKNVTGIRGDAPIQTLLKHFQTTTGATRLSALYLQGDFAADNQVEALRRVAVKRGWQIYPQATQNTMSPKDILKLVPAGAEGIYCSDSAVFLKDARALINEALGKGIPIISQVPGLAEYGAFMVLETDPVEQGEKLAYFVNRILEGCPLKDLPPERPHNVSLVINLKTANALGIQVPFEVLSVTSRLIR
jgi:putative ABC transport system substrate-binding protein